MRRLRILLGISLTTAGAVWLVERHDNLGSAAPTLLRAAPALLLTVGALQLLGLLWRSRLVAPVLLVVAGAAGIAFLNASPTDLATPSFWPIMVMLAGLALALAERGRRESDEPNIDQTALLRSRKVIRTERPFKVARVRVLLGSVELDLTNCRQLVRDVQLNLSVWLGHVSIVVPDHYQVAVHVAEGIGAVHIPTLPPTDGEAVVVKISVLGFGGAIDVRRPWSQPSAPTSAGEPPEAEEAKRTVASATPLNA